jgi:hypothetical protein
VLASAIADAPWSAKLARGCSHNACNGCWRCGIFGTTEAPDGSKLKSTAFGGYSEPAPCRVYIEEAKTWMDEEVTYNKNWLTNEEAQICQVAAARLRVTDGVFIARGNTAEKIRAEEMGKRGTQPGASAFALYNAALLIDQRCECVPHYDTTCNYTWDCTC